MTASAALPQALEAAASPAAALAQARRMVVKIGSSLLFDADPAAQRLDRWVARGGLERCGVAERIQAVRALAEALAHAHGRGVFHRAVKSHLRPTFSSACTVNTCPPPGRR